MCFFANHVTDHVITGAVRHCRGVFCRYPQVLGSRERKIYYACHVTWSCSFVLFICIRKLHFKPSDSSLPNLFQYTLSSVGTHFGNDYDVSAVKYRVLPFIAL